jgi:hypothetical protein
MVSAPETGLLEHRFDFDREAGSASHGISLAARSDQTLWVLWVRSNLMGYAQNIFKGSSHK